MSFFLVFSSFHKRVPGYMMYEIFFYINQCCMVFGQSQDAQGRVVSGLSLSAVWWAAWYYLSETAVSSCSQIGQWCKRMQLFRKSSGGSSSHCVCVNTHACLGFCCVSRDRGSQRVWDSIHKEGERGKMCLRGLNFSCCVHVPIFTRVHHWMYTNIYFFKKQHFLWGHVLAPLRVGSGCAE